jgi:hypothetical protein
METQRWINQTQPQTLVIAVFLMYFDAAFAVLGLVLGGFIGLITLIELSGVAAGWGIANEKKWGYWLGIGIATFGLLPYVYALVNGLNILSGNPLGLLFAIAKFALLVHPQSREYQKIWFK